MKCYRDSGPVGSRCLKCTKGRKRCEYPVGAEEEEEEEEEDGENDEDDEDEDQGERVASSSKGKGKAVDPQTPDRSSGEDSESTPETPAVKKKLISGFMGALSKAVKRKVADRSPEEVVLPPRDSSTRPHPSEAVPSPRYCSVNVSTEDLVLYNAPVGPLPSLVPPISLPSSHSGSSSNLSIDSDPRDIEILRLRRELSRASADMDLQVSRFNHDVHTQSLRHRQDVDFYKSLFYNRAQGQERGRGRGLERGRGA